MPEWSDRCRCGNAARWTLVYVWGEVEEKRERVCDGHYHSALDYYEVVRRRAPEAVDGLRILVAS